MGNGADIEPSKEMAGLGQAFLPRTEWIPQNRAWRSRVGFLASKQRGEGEWASPTREMLLHF